MTGVDLAAREKDIATLLAMVDDRQDEWHSIRDAWRARRGDAAMEGWRWWWMLGDEESYQGDYATREEALAEAARENAFGSGVTLIEARVWADDLDDDPDIATFAAHRMRETIVPGPQVAPAETRDRPLLSLSGGPR